MGEELLLLSWSFADFCVAGSVLGCLYTLLAIVLTIRAGRRPCAAPRVREPVTVLKPLCGDDPGLLARLAPFCSQTYEGPVQIVFGVHDRADRAIEVVHDLKTAFPDTQIDLKVDGRIHGTNRKVSNLANMNTLTRHDVVVLSDGDIEVRQDYLAGVVGALQQPGVGAVTCLYYGLPRAEGLWPRLAAISTNTNFLPNAVVAMSLGLARPCFGATVALRRDTLKRIGGFAPFADCLADDYALGEAVRATGQEIVIAPDLVGHACVHRSAAELQLHQIRAAKTIRGIDPVGYVGSIITNPLPFALLGLLCGAAGGVLAVAAAVILRSVLCLAVEKVYRLPRQPYWLVPLNDALEFAIYISSFFGGKVSWKGYRYRVMSDGTLIQDSHPGRS
jgi:ceramide glucosyltransferase